MRKDPIAHIRPIVGTIWTHLHGIAPQYPIFKKIIYDHCERVRRTSKNIIADSRKVYQWTDSYIDPKEYITTVEQLQALLRDTSPLAVQHGAKLKIAKARSGWFLTLSLDRQTLPEITIPSAIDAATEQISKRIAKHARKNNLSVQDYLKRIEDHIIISAL